jgi:hypothetical protein
MRMRGNLPPRHVGFIRGGFEFFKSELRSARTVTLGQNSSCSHDLDYVHAILYLCADHVPDLVNAVGNGEIALRGKHAYARLRRVVVQVTVTTSDGNARAAGNNARAGNKTFIDRIAQVHGKKWLRANVTHGSKTGLQSLAGIEHSGKSGLKRRVLEAVDFLVSIGARAQMRMAIDESGKNGGVRKINHCCAAGDADRSRGPNTLNAVTQNRDHNIFANAV